VPNEDLQFAERCLQELVDAKDRAKRACRTNPVARLM
jgi:hypothetical protein